MGWQKSSFWPKQCIPIVKPNSGHCIYERTHTLTPTAVLFVVSLVIFPAGMDEPPVRELCGAAAGKYNKADCDIGWAFIVIIVGTVFALIAGVFFSWTTRRWRDKEDDESYSI